MTTRRTQGDVMQRGAAFTCYSVRWVFAALLLSLWVCVADAADKTPSPQDVWVNTLLKHRTNPAYWEHTRDTKDYLATILHRCPEEIRGLISDRHHMEFAQWWTADVNVMFETLPDKNKLGNTSYELIPHIMTGIWLHRAPDDISFEKQLITIALTHAKDQFAAWPNLSKEFEDRFAMLCALPVKAKQEPDATGPWDRRWLELHLAIHQKYAKLDGLEYIYTMPASMEQLKTVFGDTYATDTKYATPAYQAFIEQLPADESDWPAYVAKGKQLRFDVQVPTKETALWLQQDTHLPMAAELQQQLVALREGLLYRDYFKKMHSQVLEVESTIVDSDRDEVDAVLRRTQALLRHLRDHNEGLAAQLSPLDNRVQRLAQAIKETPMNLRDARVGLYFELCRVRREIAFSNPLLNFDQLLFAKRDLVTGYITPQTEYYGYLAKGGGSLFVLQNPFSAKAQMNDLLVNSVCEDGRYKGNSLKGEFLSPALSYDGKTIFFCFSEVPPKNDKGQLQGNMFEQKYCFHIYSVNTDGAHLRQLTDGPYNDLFPQPLPDGRIVFVSMRRGSMGRSSTGPAYTLHTMNLDGSDIRRISHHEGHEWKPSVNNQGQILYTRWDSWDKSYFRASNAWITYPDGRDGRSFFGNYELMDNTMCEDLRAVPGSQKIMALFSCYQDVSYGSVVLLDPSVEDHGLNMLARLTPDQPLPAQDSVISPVGIGRGEGPRYYGTPWPLSERFFLCVYDAQGDVTAPTPLNQNNFGIYLVDAFGNKELIYRDPAISCISPMPLRPPPCPPSLLESVNRSQQPGSDAQLQPYASDIAKAPQAEIGLINVYIGEYPIPADIHVRYLRIYAVPVKKTNEIARFGSEALFGHDKGVRTVLGTVPVEDDGSAFFKAPANVPLFFQALDEKKLAVQSMRSVTYAQPNERLLCLGCHERRSVAPPVRGVFAKAFTRDPSPIAPEPEEATPLAFAKLVQPVLDNHCVRCHNSESVIKDKKQIDLTWGDWSKRDKAQFRRNDSDWYYFSNSYISLADYTSGFRSHVGDGGTNSPLAPLQQGAYKCRLYTILKDGHKDVKLSDAEMYRLTLWMDANCMFMGDYDNLARQANGEFVAPLFEYDLGAALGKSK